MFEFFRKIGPLRVLHGLTIVILVVTAPFADGSSARSGLAMWPTLIAPAVAPIFLFVLPLDMTMAAIGRSSAESDDERRRLTTVLRFDVLLLVVLVLAWLPFFMALASTPG